MKTFFDALSMEDWTTAGRWLAAATPAERDALAAELPDDLRARLLDGRLFDAAWELIGHAEAMGPAIVSHPHAAGLAALVSSLGPQLAGLDDRHPRSTAPVAAATEALARTDVDPLPALAALPAPDRDRGLLRDALLAQLAALRGDLPDAARRAAAVLRAHGRTPSPRAAVEAAWLVAHLARRAGDVRAEIGALRVCAGAAARCDRPERRRQALERLGRIDTSEAMESRLP
jgi:hypothetical protein